MNDELRKEIIQYRMESAEALLKEIDSHINNGFIIRLSTGCIMLAFTP